MSFLLAVLATFHILMSGDFPGWAPWEEDAPIVSVLLAASVNPPSPH